MKSVKQNFLQCVEQFEIKFSTYSVQFTEAVRTDSAPQFRLCFANVVAAVSALEQVVYYVVSVKVFTACLFHKKSMGNCVFLIRKNIIFTLKSCI